MKNNSPVELEVIRIRPTFGLSDSGGGILPQISQKTAKLSRLERIKRSQDEKAKKVLTKRQELFYEQEAISEYWKEIMTDRNKRYQRSKLKQIQNKAKYASDYNYKWKQRLLEQKCLSAEREINFFQENSPPQFRQHSQSIQLPRINEIKESQRKRSEPIVQLQKKQSTTEFMTKLRKIVYCSYQKELKNMKRSYEIAAKLDHDDYRVMKPKFPAIKYNKRPSEDTFITSQNN